MNYLACAVKIVTDNTATIAGAKGIQVSHMAKNLSDLTTEPKKPVKPVKSGQEIASDIIERLAKKD